MVVAGKEYVLTVILFKNGIKKVNGKQYAVRLSFVSIVRLKGISDKIKETRMKKLFVKLVAKLFGLRLPCGHGRIKARIGSLYSCNVCGRTYRLCIFISPKE